MIYGSQARKMKAKAFTIFLLLTFLFADKTFSQWKVYKYEPSNAIADTIWSLRKVKPSLFNYKCYFAEYAIDDKELLTGYELSKKEYVKIKTGAVRTDEIPGFRQLATNPRLVLYQQIFAKNIGSYIIRFHVLGENAWYEHLFKIEFERQQIPSNITLTDFCRHSDPNAKFTGKAGDFIDKVQIDYRPKAADKSSNFIIGNFAVGNERSEPEEVHSSFFDAVLNRKGNDFEDYCNLQYGKWLPRNNSILFPTLESFKYQNFESGVVRFISAQKGADEMPVFKNLIRVCALNYPFYDERNINRKQTLEKVEQFLSKPYNDIYALADSSAKFIQKTFNDGHFAVVQNQPVKTSLKAPGPVRLYQFGNDVFVSAVFDPFYASLIPVGSKVESIDSHPIHELIDQQQYNNLLIKTKNDSVVIQFRKNLDDRTIYSVTVKYTSEMVVPQNFRPIHCSFKMDVDSIAYFRINTWDRQVYLRFMNNWNEINSSKGLIIDLRGNSGGSDVPAQRLLSIFLNKPHVFQNVIASSGFNQLESLVSNTQKHFHYSTKKPVVILIDENTACGSESFVMCVKDLGNATIIGDHKSRGILAARIDVHFPSGIILQMNSLLGKPIYGTDKVIETVGISPDIWVLRTNVLDLAPYNDKVLQVAQKLIRVKRWED